MRTLFKIKKNNSHTRYKFFVIEDFTDIHESVTKNTQTYINNF